MSSSSNNPLVSIACAVYNGEATLARALSRVVEQDYENIEVLIGDDQSTDASRAIYEAFAERDPRIKVTRNAKNLGIVENFNSMIRRATGKYFMLADQDDLRDKTFVRKAVAALEADPEAVLCHSHTGVFIENPDDVKYLITLKGVDGVRSRVGRYARFLWRLTDTTIYGLVRRDALLKTALWRSQLGSANTLLCELLLLGKFIQLPEVLYLYSAKGIKNRPNVKGEYARLNLGRAMPRLYFPFLVVAVQQTKDIFRSPAVGTLEKGMLGSVVWGHASMVALTKLAYRAVATRVPVPDSVTAFLDSIVMPRDHLVPLNGTETNEDIFPLGWAIKGGE